MLLFIIYWFNFWHCHAFNFILWR